MVTNIQCGAPTEYSQDIQQYQMHADIFSEFNFEYTMHRKNILNMFTSFGSNILSQTYVTAVRALFLHIPTKENIIMIMIYDIRG